MGKMQAWFIRESDGIKYITDDAGVTIWFDEIKTITDSSGKKYQQVIFNGEVIAQFDTEHQEIFKPME